MLSAQSVRWSGVIAVLIAISMACSGDQPVDEAPSEGADNTEGQALPTLQEARMRAELLQETIHATLHVVHRDFYREDEGLPIPATSLTRVFKAMEASQDVSLHWLVVNAEAMNVDHKPRDEFERLAVATLSSGQSSHEQAEAGIYRRAGVITLTSECLKCHLPNRRSTADRAAGLVISIPYRANQ
jgi:hypothetical protein